MNLILSKDDPASLQNSARTAVAAIAAYLIGILLHLPEPYWAPISTIVVTQSSMGAALPISVQRFVGTAIGAVVGALTATYFHQNLWAFGAAVFLIGVFCASLRIARSAFRYAGITLAVVMLIPRGTNVWVIAMHRSLEVSLGIAVGLAVSAWWPERKASH